MRNGARAIGAGLLAGIALVGFAAAFALASTAGAGELQSTDPPPTTEPPPPEPPPPPPRPTTIASGVTIGGVAVGGMRGTEATTVVRKAFDRPLVLVVGPQRKVRVAPRGLGARPNIAKSVKRARSARPGAEIPLDVDVPRDRIAAHLDRLGRDADRSPVDARTLLRGESLRVVPAKAGRRLQRLAATRAVRAALATHSRNPITLSFAEVKPKVTETDVGTAVVILRESKKLRFYVMGKVVRTFGVATGAAGFATPIGAFEITTLQRNPWWYPPPSPWASGKTAVPPGPGNPLGTRWMGISSPFVGIHGTPDAASIGYSASHGCVRMRIPDAEWLFERVRVGTPVFIVRR
ncbi:MAG: L,D-transpeptidase family protein [Gaiellaceae bacterium]